MSQPVDSTVFTWKHILYRLVDAEGRLLYVGITSNLDQRFSAHGQKWWWPRVADVRLEFFPDRLALERAELVTIKSECPLHNVIGNPVPVMGPVRAPHRRVKDVVRNVRLEVE